MSKENASKIPLTSPAGIEIENVDCHHFISVLNTQWHMQVEKGIGNGTRPRVALLLGAPGIGKTQIVKQFAEEKGADFISPDISLMAKEDFLGLPDVVSTQKSIYNDDGVLIKMGEGVSIQNPVNFLPFWVEKHEMMSTEEGRIEVEKKHGKGSWLAKTPIVIFLDEIPNAHKTVLNAVKKFIQDYAVNTHLLPANCMIVAAGNRPIDSPEGASDLFELDKALGGRFVPMNFVPKMSEWIDWADRTNKRYHEMKKINPNITMLYVLPEIIDFLKRDAENQTDDQYGDNMYNLTNSTRGAFATPRTWVEFSKECIANVEMNDGELNNWYNVLSEDQLRFMCRTAVGRDAAQAFMMYISVMRELDARSVEMILTDPEAAPMMRSLQVDPELGRGLKMEPFYGLLDYLMKTDELNVVDNPTLKLKYIYNVGVYMVRTEQLEIISAGFSYLEKQYKEMSAFDAKRIDALDREGKDTLEDLRRLINEGKESGLQAKSFLDNKAKGKFARKGKKI